MRMDFATLLHMHSLSLVSELPFGLCRSLVQSLGLLMTSTMGRVYAAVFRLELRDAMVEDSGTYILTVNNDFGSTQSTANVLVKGQDYWSNPPFISVKY